MTLYLDGQGIDEHLGEVSEVRGPKAYVTDHLGSVLNGEAAGSAKAFGAFGERLDSSPIVFNESTPPVLYGFTGRELDPESMNYHYRARTYSPELGRFVQPDPIGFAGGDVNLYRYVKNNPLGLVDPSGYKPDDPAYWGTPGGADPEAVQRGINVGATVGGTAVVLTLAAPMVGPLVTYEARLAAGAAKSAIDTALVYCAQNPKICTGIAGGFASGLTSSKLPPSGSTTPEQAAVSWLSNQIGKQVKNACER